MAEETQEKRRPSLAPPPPPTREQRQEREADEQEDPIAQARAKLEDAQESISDALDLLEQ
jgi:hypothetical protein